MAERRSAVGGERRRARSIDAQDERIAGSGGAIVRHRRHRRAAASRVLLATDALGVLEVVELVDGDSHGALLWCGTSVAASDREQWTLRDVAPMVWDHFRLPSAA